MVSDLVLGLLDNKWHCHCCGQEYQPHPDPSTKAEECYCPKCLALVPGAKVVLKKARVADEQEFIGVVGVVVSEPSDGTVCVHYHGKPFDTDLFAPIENIEIAPK